MKYNGFYFRMFKGPMKKVLIEKYNKAYAAEVMKKSKAVYRQLVEQADDIGDDNPMAYNELFALALSHQMVLCKDRPEHRQGQSGKQKERRQIRQMVHIGKGKAGGGVTFVTPPLLCSSAESGRHFSKTIAISPHASYPPRSPQEACPRRRAP